MDTLIGVKSGLMDYNSLDYIKSNKEAQSFKNALSAKPANAHQANAGNDIEKVAKDFEGYVLSHFISLMFKDVKAPSLFGGGSTGENIFQNLLFQEYGKMIATTPLNLGIADTIMLQAAQRKEAPPHFLKHDNPTSQGEDHDGEQKS